MKNKSLPCLFLSSALLGFVCLSPMDIKNCSVHSSPVIFFGGVEGGGCFRYNRRSDFVRNVALKVSKSKYANEFEGKMSPSK
jgi:hypothetical protein